MRPSIVPSHSIVKSLLYNEQKLSLLQAECILAANFLKDLPSLTWEDKLLRFERRQQLNERVITNQHISLNFHPDDKLSNEQMQNIARVYMRELGFERQPYLVYRHYDAGHPHCHIVTTHIQANGDPIPQYKLGENQSEKARILIEEEFNLVTTEKQRLTQRQSQTPDRGIPKIKYGERPTTSALSEVIQHVMEKYNYTNLEEYNATLRLYNVQADPGPEGSKLRQHHGLLYRVLDDEGHTIGRPIKASFFDSKPTLHHLEEKFKLNQSLRQELKQSMEIRIQWEITKQNMTIQKLERQLIREGICLDIRKDRDGGIRDVFFIDVRNKCSIKADSLPEPCQKQAIQELSLRQNIHEELTLKQTQRQRHRLRHSL